MNEARTNYEPELLLAQVEWVRGLARGLARDAALAEDLAQGALLAALRRPPSRAESAHSLRAWLSRVLRNCAREERRSEAHRRAREAESARNERLSSAADVVERAATHRAVVEAVLALSEPYRATILLRHFDGLSIARIAVRTGASEEAVRKRLSRGMAMLRARLEAEDPRGLSAALLALAGHGGAWDVAWSAKIGAAMSAKSVAVASAVALAAVLFVGWRRFGAPGAPSFAGVLEAESAQAELAPDPDIASGAETSAFRTTLSEASSDALVVIEVDTNRPLAGAEVHLARRLTREELTDRLNADWEALGIAERAQRWLMLAGEEAIPPDPAAPEQPPFVPRALELLGETDADGRFPLRDLRGVLEGNAGVIVTHAAGAAVFAPAAWLSNEQGVERVIALPPLRALRVRFVDAMTGAPVAGAHARVELELAPASADLPRPLLDPLRWLGPSDAQGRLEVAALPAGAPLWLTALGEFSARPQQIWIDASEASAEREVRTWRLGSLRGRLVRPDGSPIEGLFIACRGPWALVSIYPSQPRTDVEGTFAIENAVAGRGRILVQTHQAAAFPLLKLDVEVPPDAIGDLGEIVVPELVELAISVLVPEGAQPNQVLVELRQDGEQISGGGSYSEGVFRYRVPAGDCELAVLLQEGWYRRVVATRQVQAPADEIVIDLTRSFGELRAHLPEGFPDVECFARFFDEPDPIAREWTLNSSLPRAAAVERGALAIPLLPPGEYDVELSFGEHGSARFEQVAIRAGETRDLGLIEIAGGALEGVVTDAGGRPVAGARVHLIAPPLDLLEQGDPSRREAKTDEHGRYRIGTLDARSWTAWAEHAAVGASAVHRIPIAAGVQRARDFELGAPCFVRGTITRRGEPARDAEISWSYGGFQDVKLEQGAPFSLRPEADGSYALGPFLPGDYAVLVRGDDGGSCPFHLEPGTDARVDFELDESRRTLRLALHGEPLAGIESVSAVCIDPESPLYGRTSRGRVRGPGQIEIALPPAQAAIQLLCGRFEPLTYAQVIVDGATIADGAIVNLPEGVLEVELGPGALHRERPKLHLLAVPGGELPRVDALVIKPHPFELEPGLVRFVCLPDGARCLLVGPDADGRRRAREVLIRGEGVQRERWE